MFVAHRATQPTAPAPAQPPAMVQQQQQPGLFAQMASTAAGVAVGSTVGHVVGGVISSAIGGGRSHEVQSVQEPVQQQQQQFSNDCSAQNDAFLRCLDSTNNDMTMCQSYFDVLKECKAAAPRAYY